MLATGHVAIVRTDNLDFIAKQSGEIALCCSMLPHPQIHSRSNHHRGVCRHQKRCRKIIGMTACHLSHEICRGWGNKHKVGYTAQLDMAHLGLICQIKEISVDFLARQSRNREGRNKFLRCACQNGRYACAAFLQPTNEIEAFICRDTAADDKQYSFASQHSGPRIFSIITRVKPSREQTQWAQANSIFGESGTRIIS